MKAKEARRRGEGRMVVRNDGTLRQRKGKGTPASEDVVHEKMELVRFTPVADRRWRGKMQRMAQGGCAVRGARQNAGVNARKWGTLDEKRGTLNGKCPMFASSYRKGEEKSKRKLKKGRKR